MFRSAQKVLLAKEESVYGTDPTPTVVANSIEARNIKVNYRGDVLERPIQGNDLSPYAPVMGKRWIECSFEAEIKGSGAAGTAPRLGDLFEACGFAETVAAGVSVVYKPSGVVAKSITMYVYDIPDSGSARLHKLTGCRGTVNLRAEAGQLAVAEFQFSGIYNAPADVAAPAAPTFETSLPPIVQSAAFTINSIATLIAQSLSIDAGVDLVQQDDINSAGGLKGFQIIGRKPTGSFSPEAVTVASYGWWADWLAATQRAMSLVIGSAAGNKCTITAPNVTVDQISEADRNSITVDEVAFRCNRNAGNDELVLTFE